MIRFILIPLLAVAGSAFANPSEDGTQGGDGTATTELPAKPVVTPPASAPAPNAQLFLDLDVNKDGALERTEITKVDKLGEQFATVDTDKNGKLSKVEYEAWTAKVSERR